MKFDDIIDFKVLNTCLATKELLVTPTYHTSARKLGNIYTRNQISALNAIIEETYYASLQDQEPSEESKQDLRRLFKIASKHDVKSEHSSYTNTLMHYMDSAFSIYEIKRLRGMKTDSERLDTITSYYEDPDLAPTDLIQTMSHCMVRNSSSYLVKKYIDDISDAKRMYAITPHSNPQLFEKLSDFQRHFEELSPLCINSPRKESNAHKVFTDLMVDLSRGQSVRQAAANFGRTTVGRYTIAAAITLGLVTTLGLSAINGYMHNYDTNHSTFPAYSISGLLDSRFTNDQLLKIASYENQFSQYKDGVLPSNSDFEKMLDSIDDFYSDTIKQKLLASYNDYAEQNDKPQGRYITFEYNDYDRDSGPRNILKVTDEKGKTFDVDMETPGLFNNNNISVIFNAERRIDEYKNQFAASPNAAIKRAILSDLHEDFSNVLNACTLDYTYKETGLLKRIFGKDFELVTQSVLKDLQEERSNNFFSSLSQQAETEEQTQDNEPSL